METNPRSPSGANSSNPQPYPLREAEDGFYFTTDEGINYYLQLKFRDGYFDAASFSDDVAEFSIVPIGQKVGRKRDSRIMATIVEMFNAAFFDKPNLIVIYICSLENNQEILREYLFTKWFRQNSKGFVKIDFNRQEKRQYASVIFQENHPYRDEIIEIFTEINNK
ncbi:DUF6169 family protein [Larkinella terrae]|uniref:Uncharacterized protein n=1 Tax=Larkinella terrae TaxID=2025311 RepID=A0A7K0EUR4_9BACT|nr:DUF6169 family protein [Larkinella terrae]MRS65550.1 hypothetical protein [Larkinella terrae]